MDALCDLHLEGLFAQLRGTAAARGHTWADQLAIARREQWTPWPEKSERVNAVALTWVEDLTRDPRLRAKLVAELVTYAARRWEIYRPAFAMPSA